jgi:5'(3')-deoxyribonucleotidase
VRINVDCDGVLSDFVRKAHDVVGSLGFRRPLRHETDHWKLHECDWFTFNSALNPGFAGHFWRAMRAPGVARDMRPTPALPELVSLFRAIEADVTVVTAPMRDSTSWASERVEWLAWCLNYPHEIVLSRHKERFGADLFLDDHEENCAKWQAAHPRGQAILWRTPYMRERPGFPHVGSALELAGYLLETGAAGPTRDRVLEWVTSPTRVVVAAQEAGRWRP